MFKKCTKCGKIKPLGEFSRNRTRKDGRNHRCKSCESSHEYAPNRTCEVCGNPFYAAPSNITKGLGRFCSKACMGKSRDRRVARNCVVCGKEFQAHNYEIEQGRGRFCSVSCEGRWRKGDRGARWMGDNPINPDNAGHKRAQAQYELKPCEICGATPKDAVIHRHHIDENPMNNAPDNIAFLCALHHREAHRRKGAR